VRTSDLLDLLDTALPEIKRTGDPEAALLKCARAENLAPAQLEKMAQLYNTAKNLTYLDKSGTRGGSFSIIHTEKLLEDYTAQEPHPKKATWVPELIKSASSDTWFDAPVEEYTSAAFPDLELAGMRAAIKQAAAPSNEPSAKELQKMAEVEARDLLTYEQIQDDAREDAFRCFRKFADFIHSHDIPFQEVRDDMNCIVGPEVAMTFDALNRFNPGFKSAAAQPQKFAYDRHGLEGLVREMHDAVTLYDGATQIIKEAVSAPTATNPTTKPLQTASPQTASPPPTFQRPPAPQNPTTSTSKGTQSAPKGDNGDDKGGRGNSGKEKSDSKSDSFGEALDQFLEPARKMNPVSGVFSQILGPGAGKGIPGWKGRNTRQETVDTAADDAQHTALMERLLITDPILSQAEPDDVVGLANSIRQANPEAGNDINFMRFALREALQYGAMPQHTYKDLVGMRKDLAQATSAEYDTRDKMYGGGSNPK
jgi:hypothetical protein